MIYRADFIQICSAFKYLEIEKYFDGLVWKRIDSKNDSISIFQKPIDMEDFWQVIIPRKPKSSDYGKMMYNVAEELSKAQERSLEEVVLELANPLTDIVKVRIDDSSVLYGSVLFEDAIGLFNNAKNMIKFAAQDALNYRKYYNSGRIIDDVHKFLDICRFGQTEIGSYITNIVCPFVYKDKSDLMQQLSLFDDENQAAVSLTRKTTKKLMDSLHDIKECIDHGDDLEKLTDRQQNPISINFLESLTSLNLIKPDGKLDIDLKWAKTVYENKSQTNAISFNNNYYAPINACAKRIENEQQSDKLLQYVGRIKATASTESLEKREFGIIKLVTIENDKKKVISVKVDFETYEEAVNAHRDGLFVRVKGKMDEDNKVMLSSEFEIIE